MYTMLDSLLTFKNQAWSLQSTCTNAQSTLKFIHASFETIPMIHLMVGFKSLDKIVICFNNFITLP